MPRQSVQNQQLQALRQQLETEKDRNRSLELRCSNLEGQIEVHVAAESRQTELTEKLIRKIEGLINMVTAPGGRQADRIKEKVKDYAEKEGDSIVVYLKEMTGTLDSRMNEMVKCLGSISNNISQVTGNKTEQEKDLRRLIQELLDTVSPSTGGGIVSDKPVGVFKKASDILLSLSPLSIDLLKISALSRLTEFLVSFLANLAAGRASSQMDGHTEAVNNNEPMIETESPGITASTSAASASTPKPHLSTSTAGYFFALFLIVWAVDELVLVRAGSEDNDGSTGKESTEEGPADAGGDSIDAEGEMN